MTSWFVSPSNGAYLGELQTNSANYGGPPVALAPPFVAAMPAECVPPAVPSPGGRCSPEIHIGFASRVAFKIVKILSCLYIYIYL